MDTTRFAAIAESIRRDPTDAELTSIATLAREQQRLEREVAEQEKVLAKTKADLAKVSEVDLPNAMSVAGLSEFTLTGGQRIEVKPEYYANIPSPDSDTPELVERRNGAFKWLRDNNCGGIIKAQILVQAGRGEVDIVTRRLNEAGVEYKSTELVHPQTLKAFVKEQLEGGNGGTPFPSHLFGAHVKRVARMKG